MKIVTSVGKIVCCICGSWLAFAPGAWSATPPKFTPTSPCRVLDAWDEPALVAGESRVLAFDASSCAVPDGATAVLLALSAVEATAPVSFSVLPGSRWDVAPVFFTATVATGGTAAVAVPLDAARTGLVGVQATFAGAEGSVSLTLDVVGFLAEAATFSGTTGFITTRPRCAPPGYAAAALNYLQGPEPIQLPNGDVTILVGSGRCCTGHWEGIFALNYPAAGRAATPRFRGLWATNDFSNQRTRKEAEVGFPSALFYNGKWRVALASAFLPFHRPNRDRVGRLDLVDLATRAKPAQLDNMWVKPIDPACRNIASCTGGGSGLDPVLTLHPNGDLYVYHLDGNYPACPSGYVRHRVAADLTVQSSGGQQCVSFAGLTKSPFLISDIARTRDGRMSLLVERLEGQGYIAEWTSTGNAAEIGLHWQPSGRLWPSPAHPNGAPWGNYVRDAGFLKDHSRTILEPNVVVAQISDGTTYSEMVDVQRGRWFLYYWADDGAVLPPTFGGPANGCAFQGVFESASCTEIRGWAWDPMFATSPISVDILADGKLVATIPADQFRADLQAAGRGDGRHGFVWPLASSLRDGKKHRISVRFAETVDGLSGKARNLTCR
jgi:hypothetical protein